MGRGRDRASACSVTSRSCGRHPARRGAQAAAFRAAPAPELLPALRAPRLPDATAADPERPAAPVAARPPAALRLSRGRACSA